MSAIAFRLRIRNGADSADALTVTSAASGTNPYISVPPTGDGQSFDPRTGKTTVGAYTVRIADNGGTANAVTGFLPDAAGRYDKLGRKAILESSTDGGATWPNQLVSGYVTAVSFPSAAEAQVSVGEAQRAERTKSAFQAATTSFPATTMMAGGPVRWPAGVTVPFDLPDRGPWTMKVSAVYGGGAAVTPLSFVSGYVLESEMSDAKLATKGVLPTYTRDRINTLLSTEVPGATVDLGFFRHGNVFADVYSAGTLVGTYHGLSAGTSGAGNFLNTDGSFAIEWNGAGALGTSYQVYLYTRTVSENSPLHIFLHPIAIVTGLLDDAGELWDATTAATITASIGADVRVLLRVTQSEPTEDAIARLLGLFGVGRRMNSAGTWEFFDQRSKGTSAPATTITQDDLREIPSDVWSLADSTILNNVTVESSRFAIWAPGQSSTRPPDGLVPVQQKRTARFQLADGSYPETSQGVKAITYTLPGTITNANAAEVSLTDFANALAAPAFDRWGYGAPSTTLACRSTVTVQIGDEVLLDLPFLPNNTVRGGQRIVQVVQRTNEPGGPVLVVEDAGSSAQPALAPTFTIAASTRNPETAADLVLTNAAALAAAGVVSVLVEWAVSASSPAVAGQDLGSVIPASPLTLTTPPCAAGSKVWARMKSIQPGKRAGAFTAWAGVTLTGVGAATSLAFAADGTDGSKGTLSWTAGTNSSGYRLRVLVSDGTAIDLPATSTRAALIGLTLSASYTATVQYLDPASGIVASSATLSFTAGSVAYTLAAPVRPAGIVGASDPNGIMRADGTYGLDVTAVALPGVVEFWEAVETSAGAGTYGTSVLVRTQAAVSGAVTPFRNVAPHDGLRRQLKARSTRQGVTESAYTATTVVNPWGAVQSPAGPDATTITGEIVAAQIAAAAITTAKFAAGIRPVRIVAALPGAGDLVGDVVFLTSDNKLYRWDGSGWTAAVPTVDLTGTIATAQIAVAAITTSLLAAAAVTTTKIADGSISTPKLIAGAVTANELAAGSVTAAKIVAGTITATELAAGSVTTAKLVAGSVTSNELAANSVIAGKVAAAAISTTELAAGAVTAAKIAAGTITANEIAANTITAGKLNVATLAAVSANLGAITAGTIVSATGALTLDFNASGTSAVISAANFQLLANGDCRFQGELQAASGTFTGSLTAATGTFAGSLSAATGTFAGSLTAAAIVASTSFTASVATFSHSIFVTDEVIASSVRLTPGLDIYWYSGGTYYGTVSGLSAGTYGAGLYLSGGTGAKVVILDPLTLQGQAVTFGAANSGGAGFRQVLVPN